MSEHTSEKKFALNLPVAILLAAFLIAGAIILTRPTAPVVATTQGNTVTIRSVSPQDHYYGSKNAQVTIVEFADFQCPFCSVIYPTLKQIVDNSNGKIAWVYRDFPLTSIHPQAQPAAEAAECIAGELGNDAFWKFADAIFNDQNNMSPDRYAAIAKQLGADPAAFASCVANKQFDQHITDDSAEAIQSGAQGTPFTVVMGKNGTSGSFSGALPFDQVNAVVQSILNKQTVK